MAQINLTSQERHQALRRLGYNEREAGFVCTAALHGGYFLRRQLGLFLGQRGGGTAAALIDKLLSKGHAKGTTFARNIQIYHLSSRPLYAALGQEDNRNRRLRQPVTIKNKLMGLDFVLRHRHNEYLATEQEKVEYFTAQLGLERALLPANRYTGRGRVAERFFVEKFPISLSQSSEPLAPPVVSFCFVDEGEATLSGFYTFLHRYSLLLTHLREFRVIYVAANDAHFQAAESAFERFSEQCFGRETSVPTDPLIARLLEHFEARRLHEGEKWETFDRAKLIRLRDDRQEFSGEKYEALYRLWKASGDSAVKAVLNAKPKSATPARWMFLTCELKENYDLFGHITTY
jgi:hypothetical protein